MKMAGAVILLFCLGSLLFSQDFSFDENFFNDLKGAALEEAPTRLDKLEAKEAVIYAGLLSEYCKNQGNYIGAEFILRYAIDKATAYNLLSDSAFIHYKLALLYNSMRKVEQAMGAMQEATALFQELDDTESYLNSLMQLAGLQHSYGLLAESLANYEKIIERQSECADELLLAYALYEAAMVKYKIGDVTGTTEKLELALRLFEKNNHPSGLGSVHKAFGNYYSSLGNLEKALASYHKAQEYFLQSNNVHEYANTSYNIGLIKLQEEKYDEAISYFQNAISNFTSAGSAGGAGMAGAALAHAYFELNRIELALSTLQLAIVQLRHAQSNRRLAMAEELLAKIFHSVSELEKAAEHYRMARDIYNGIHLKNEAERIEEIIQKLESEMEKTKPAPAFPAI